VLIRQDVVVGAGPAGITLFVVSYVCALVASADIRSATRLAENENVTVALVEAGGFYEASLSSRSLGWHLSDSC
jgi:NADH dehydrogenase FAD-containing subunit